MTNKSNLLSVISFLFVLFTIINPVTYNAYKTNILSGDDDGKVALAYVSRTRNISPDKLKIENQQQCNFPLIKRSFSCISIFDESHETSIVLLVDKKDGSVIENVDTLQNLENIAYGNRYGKFEPILSERLTQYNDDALFDVAVWLNHTSDLPSSSIDNTGENRQVDNKEAEYDDLHLQSEIVLRVSPLLNDLRQQNIRCESYKYLPSITCRLTKKQLHEISKRLDVQTIYSIDNPITLHIVSAGRTNHVGYAWLEHKLDIFNPTSISAMVAVLEPDNVEYPNSYLKQYNTFLASPYGTGPHATGVAGAIASFKPELPGMAPGARILSAGTDSTSQSLYSGLSWAIDNQANIINVSAGTDNNIAELEWLDRAFDYLARQKNITIIASTGNNPNNYVGSPAKGWNVIAVGGIDDKNNDAWADDDMFWISPTFGSAYKNPASPHNDREKPELVAPGEDITTIQ